MIRAQMSAPFMYGAAIVDVISIMAMSPRHIFGIVLVFASVCTWSAMCGRRTTAVSVMKPRIIGVCWLSVIPMKMNMSLMRSAVRVRWVPGFFWCFPGGCAARSAK